MSNIFANTFACSLATRELSELASELYTHREHPPLKVRSDGSYEGHILSFVKGLRLSSKVIYFLRKCLSNSDLQVNWGHIINDSGQSCSPECDIVIHKPGHIEEWNGGKDPVMNFKFIHAQSVVAVVSCKSFVASIESDYPAKLARYGVNKVYLFGEACSQTNYDNLKEKALAAGYSDFWVSYFPIDGAASYSEPEDQYFQFWSTVKLLTE